MTEVEIKQSALLQFRKLSSLQESVFETLKFSLTKIIIEEVNKYSKRMKNTRVSCYHEMLQWESETKKLQQQLKEKQALIDNLKAEKENLENRIEWCSNEIENQRKEINEQANALSKKSKRIETLEGVVVARDIMIKSQNEKNLDQEQTLKSFAKTISDLKSQLAEAEHQNDLFVSDLCYYEETEHQLRFEIDKKDYYHSLYQSEMKAHDLLKSVCQEQANVHQSQLNERAQEIETLKKDLATASSELERVKLKSRTIEDRTYYNALNADEYELSLNEKDSKIQEYLEIINAKDAQILSQKPFAQFV